MRVFSRRSHWLAVVCLLGIPVLAAGRTVKICARDEKGIAVAGAIATVGNQRFEGDASGCVTVKVEDSQSIVEVSHEHFAAVRQSAGNSDELDVVLKLDSVESTVEVTAARIPLALDASANSVRTLAGGELKDSRLFTGRSVTPSGRISVVPQDEFLGSEPNERGLHCVD